MPYIKKEYRQYLDARIQSLYEVIESSGELNYTLTSLCAKFLKFEEVTYDNISRVIGTLDLVKDEMKRRLVHPYENQKIKENGDIEGYE